MLGYKNIKAVKIFSIPGRIRLQVEYLKENRNFAAGIENSLLYFSNINSVKANIKTGNLLLIYDSLSVDEAELLKLIKNTGIPIKETQKTKKSNTAGLFKEILPKEVLIEEKTLIKRFTALSAAALVVLYYSSMPVCAIAVLILGFPAIVLITAGSAFKYINKAARQKEIYVRNSKVIRQMQQLRGIVLHPGIIFNKNTWNFIHARHYLEIEEWIAKGEIEDPINKEARRLVRELRINGVNHLAILPENGRTGFIEYAEKSLGLSPIKDRKEENRFPEILIIHINHYKLNPEKYSDKKIILYGTEHVVSQKKNIYLSLKQLSNVPWLIRICRRGNEYLTRTQTVTVTLHVFGIMLSFTGYLTVSLALLMYFTNLSGNLFYLKNTILKQNEELTDGKQGKLKIAGCQIEKY